MKYMQVFALSVFLRALACADTTSAKSLGHVQTDAPPACGTPTGIHRQQIVFLDRFGKTDSFPPEYETFDGPGAAEIVRRDRAGEAVLRYYSTPRGDEFAHDQSTIGIDVLGRPWVPSLRIARPFRGDVWTLTTKVTYGFDRPTNGRGVFISVGVGENPQQPDRAVRISRTNDNADAPESRGDLGVDMVSADGESQASERFPLNRLDTYSFCIQRTQGNLSVSVSNDGIAYRRAATYSVPPGAGQDRQWFIIDGMAFAPGASADIHYVLLRAPAIPTARKATAPRRTFRRRGTPDKTISLSAKAISDAIRAGQDVDIRFAAITGPVTIAPRLKNRITFESTVFTGAVSGANATFDDNLACVNCRFAGPVNFSNALFRRKADFSGAAFDDDTRFIYTRFNDGADFTGAHFKTRAWFRVARFGQPTSFYYSDFDEGADFSSGTTFEKDVTFADFGFGSSAQSAPVKPDMAFFGSTFKDRLMFVSTLQRPASPLGEEISLQQADIKHLVLTSGDSRLTKSEPEQTGKALWIIRTNLSLLNAKVDTLVMKNLSMTGVTDFRGVAFDGPRDSIRLFNVDFANLKLDAWPVGKVLATPESRERLMSTFSANNNTVAARVVFWDLMPVSRYFQKWLERDERGRPDSYEHYLGYEASAPLLGLFWHASGYGTSVLYVLRAGLALVLFFVVVFTIVGGKNLVRIEKESSFKTRISETPSLSFGEKAIESGNISSARGLWSNRFLLAVIFSLNTVAKFGFGNVRLRTEDATRLEIYSAWTAWVLGYVWYTLLIYTISAIPALNGLLH